MKNADIAINLVNVRKELKENFEGTLVELKKIGYPAVQLSGFPIKEHKADEIKRMLESCGLKAAGSHISYSELDTDLDFYIDYMKTVGTEYIICPYLSGDLVADEEGYKRVAGIFNRIGLKLKENNMVFGYHNHNFEFERFDGKYGLDILMENTDPGLVTFEPDVYWIKRADEDITGIMRKYSRKCPLVHIKDMEPGPEQFFCEIGEGIIDFGEIFQLEEELEVKWFIVEQDEGRRPAMESAAISYESLKKLI